MPIFPRANQYALESNTGDDYGLMTLICSTLEFHISFLYLRTHRSQQIVFPSVKFLDRSNIFFDTFSFKKK